MFPRSPWRTPRTGAARTTHARPSRAARLLVPLAVLALAGTATPASAAPSDQPGGTSGVLDSRALDDLQQRASEVQRGLQEQQGEVVAAREALAEAEQAVADAEAVLGDAEGELAGHQKVVAAYASAVYRDGGALTPLTLLLTGGDPGDVLAALGFLEVVDRHAAEVIGAAEKHRQAALEQQRQAGAALEQARARAAEVGSRVAELEAAASAVTDELDKALGAVDRQLAALQKEQVEVNDRTAASWRSYLDQLTAAGLAAVPAAALRDPPAGLPPGLVPVGAAGVAPSAAPRSCPGNPPRCWCCPPRRWARSRRRWRPSDCRTRRARPVRSRGTAARWCSRSTGGRGWRSRGTRRGCSPSPPLSRPPTCSPATWCSWGRRRRAWDTWASRSTRAPCSRPTPGPARSWCARCLPTR
nr:hypothetical protein [Candidatus Blastococcus massiliensis]